MQFRIARVPRADDLTLYEGMREAARLNLPVAVHAESEELTRLLARRKIANGASGIRDYLDSRPILAEVEAIQRASVIAQETGARLQIVHVSSGKGVRRCAPCSSAGRRYNDRDVRPLSLLHGGRLRAHRADPEMRSALAIGCGTEVTVGSSRIRRYRHHRVGPFAPRHHT